MPFPLTDQDRALILAALRFFQENLEEALNEFADTATNLGQFPSPSDENVDALCITLNGGDDAEEPAFDEFSVAIPGDPDYSDPLVEQSVDRGGS